MASAAAVGYTRRLRSQRTALDRRLAAAYARLDPDAIADSYAERVAPVAARLITAGQAGALTTVRGYVRSLRVELADPFSTPGETSAGSARDAVAAIGSTVLGAIAAGRTLEDAIAWGQQLLGRTGDDEFTAVVDRELDGQARATGRFTGWEGITYGATDGCIANEGVHTFDEEIYRHPNCRCDRVLVAG